MSTQTTNLHLKKPELADAANLMELNENWDTLDDAVNTLDTGKVPITRKVNGKALSGDITLDASDVNATPIDHAATGSDYGTGTGTKYGHLKLSSSTSSTSGTDGGTAATPYAVKQAYDLAAGKASATTYSAVTSTSWTATSGHAPYTQTISVSGILATDNPIVALNLSGVSYSDVEDKQDAYSQIYRVVTASNQITVYSHEALDIALTLQLKVVR